jgi:hypothetical protein
LGRKETGRQNGVQGTVPLQQIGSTFRPDTARAGQLVGLVTAQGDEIRHLAGVYAIPVAHLGGADTSHLAGPDGVENRRDVGRQLEGVAVTACDQRRAMPSLLSLNRCRQKVVGSYPGAFAF